MRPFSTPAAAIAAGCLLLGSGPATAELADRGMLNVPGGKLAYETCGSGPRAIVLLHDGILHSAVFDDVWPKLCAQFRVVRYDRRGYGASPPATAPYTPATDLEALMQALGVKHATLVGSSSGSGVAVDFALAHPEAVDRLVLAGPWISGFDASWGFLFRTLKLGLRAKMGDLKGAAKDPYILTKNAAAERARVVAWLKANPGNLAAGMRERPLAIAKPRLGEIHAPTLILVGAIDIKDVQEQAKVLEATIPKARRVVVPDSGHLLYLERPQAFADLVTAFVAAEP